MAEASFFNSSNLADLMLYSSCKRSMLAQGAAKLAEGCSISWQSHGCPHNGCQAKVSRHSGNCLRRGVVEGVRPDTACVASVWVIDFEHNRVVNYT